jgi:hypothetical protein
LTNKELHSLAFVPAFIRRLIGDPDFEHFWALSFQNFPEFQIFFGFVGDFLEKQRLHTTMTLAKEDLTALAEAIKDLSPAANAVAIKLPTFWTEDPDVWFTQVESQFAIRSITTDQTKYHYVVAALNTTTAAEVRASLLAPPDDNKYQALKTALLAAYSRSQAQKDSELLAMSGLGDKTPTAFLRRLRGLNSDPATIFRAFFLAQLPAEVRGVLAAQNLPDLDDLAKAADRIIVARQAGSGPSAFSVAADNPVTYDQAPGVSAVSGRAGGSGGRRQPQQPRPNVSPGTPFTCHYHARFGPRAQRCESGCIFAEISRPTSTHQASGNARAGR